MQLRNLTSRIISKELFTSFKKKYYFYNIIFQFTQYSIHPIEENIFSITFFKIFARLNWFFIERIPETRLCTRNEVFIVKIRKISRSVVWFCRKGGGGGKGRRNFARKMGRFDSRGRMKAFIIRRVTEMRCRCTVTGADYFNHRGITVAFTCPNE